MFVERLEKDKDTDIRRRCRSRLNGATRCKWTNNRFVHTARGDGHRFQGVWIATCSCETSRKFSCSRTREEDRESPSSTRSSSRSKQSNAYNPFSEKSKKMIQDMGNVELFELCETSPKVQCSECLLYWNQGIVYCTCGHLLRENQSSRGILRWTLDLLSIPNYVIKKGRPHGNRHGKTEAQKEHFIAHNLRKRCIKKGFEGIHDRFQKDLKKKIVTRNSELIGLKKCIQMDEVAQKDFTHRLSSEEYERYKKTWSLSLSTHLDELHR